MLKFSITTFDLPDYLNIIKSELIGATNLGQLTSFPVPNVDIDIEMPKPAD